jgi:hypothetical protein
MQQADTGLLLEHLARDVIDLARPGRAVRERRWLRLRQRRELRTGRADSGIRRGSDIAKYLASGAQAVMIGRALLYGIAALRLATKLTGASHTRKALSSSFRTT